MLAARAQLLWLSLYATLEPDCRGRGAGGVGHERLGGPIARIRKPHRPQLLLTSRASAHQLQTTYLGRSILVLSHEVLPLLHAMHSRLSEFQV